MSKFIWVQLYIGKEKSGDVEKILPKQPNNVVVEDIADLKVAVKEKRENALKGYDAADLFVYEAGTGFPTEGENSLEPDASVPKKISARIPLRAVAPVQQQQQPHQQQEQEKKRRLNDLLFYHRAAIETGTSKSSKLAKVKKLEDGSKSCFLCGASGTSSNKIEASHVLQKQDIYATGGEEALLTLDTLKNWSAGFGWKRPFKIHEPMNLIWLCHTHNLAFDRHNFGLSLGGLDNSVVFFSCLDEYGQLVADANARLADSMQPFYDMSYVSRRAIGMRLCKAQDAGYFIDHSNPNRWEAVVALSAAASLKHGSDSDDEEEIE